MKLLWIVAAAAALAAAPKALARFGPDDGECGPRPNCVSTLELREPRRMAPWTYTRRKGETLSRLERMVTADPNAAIVEFDNLRYLHATYRTKLFHFVDDVEFWLPDDEAVIHFRSASRKGYWDFGANRKRMKRLTRSFQETP